MFDKNSITNFRAVFMRRLNKTAGQMNSKSGFNGNNLRAYLAGILLHTLDFPFNYSHKIPLDTDELAQSVFQFSHATTRVENESAIRTQSIIIKYFCLIRFN